MKPHIGSLCLCLKHTQCVSRSAPTGCVVVVFPYKSKVADVLLQLKCHPAATRSLLIEGFSVSGCVSEFWLDSE